MNEEQATGICGEVASGVCDILMKALDSQDVTQEQEANIIAGTLSNIILTYAIHCRPIDHVMTTQEILSAVSFEVIDRLVTMMERQIAEPERYLLATDRNGDVYTWDEMEGEIDE
jgi:hypothetical protein